MTFMEKLILIKYFDRLDKAYIDSMAYINGHTVMGYKKKIVDEVFSIKKLSNRQRDILYEHINNMSEDELDLIEKVNHMSLCNLLEREVEAYD